MKLLHAFSPTMLGNTKGGVTTYMRQITTDQAINLLKEYGVESAIGKANLANVLTNMLGIKIETKPCKVVLNPNEQVIIAQYYGPTMADDADTLPDNARINFYVVMKMATPDLGFIHAKIEVNKE